MLFTSSLLAILLQVGPDAARPDTLGAPDELINRPARPEAQEEALPPESQWLSECLDLIEEDPARAHAQAQIKRAQTDAAGRVLANHCLGLAATQLGLWDDAITAFTAARDGTPSDELRARARFGAMGGNAALAAGDAAQALTILQRAQQDASASASAPLQAIVATDLARALVSLERPEEALAQLETAASLVPQDSGTWLLKATLLRRLEQFEPAQTAIERASEIAPTDAAIGLEAGIIAVLAGREEAARQSWQSVIEIAPDSPAADTARGYIAQLGPASQASQ